MAVDIVIELRFDIRPLRNLSRLQKGLLRIVARRACRKSPERVGRTARTGTLIRTYRISCRTAGETVLLIGFCRERPQRGRARSWLSRLLTSKTLGTLEGAS
jgi:hypothetical protein